MPARASSWRSSRHARHADGANQQQLQDVADNYFTSAGGLEFNGRPWQCPQCHFTVRLKRRPCIVDPPVVLMVGLKRWQTEIVRGEFVQKKEGTRIKVPPLVIVGGHVYRVRATVHHVGETPAGGHYYAMS